MSKEPSFSAAVLLAGADEAAVVSLQVAAEVLESFGIAAHKVRSDGTGSAAIMPRSMCAVIVASPDAALPAAFAVAHPRLPVVRVPTEESSRGGVALLDGSDGTLPAGPADGVFATMAIGQAGAKNAALFVIAALAVGDERLRTAWEKFRTRQTEAVLQHPPLVLADHGMPTL